MNSDAGAARLTLTVHPSAGGTIASSGPGSLLDLSGVPRPLVLCSTAASVESFTEMRATYEANREQGDAQLLEQIYGSDEYQRGDPPAVERFWRV